MTVACPVKNPAVGCDYGPDWNGDDHWYNAEQVIAPGDLNGDGSPDLLVKQGKQLWAYYGGILGTLDANGEPVLVGSTGWDKYTVIAPGDVNGDKVPDLWLRDNATGDILRTYGKKGTDGQSVDLATWGTQTRTKIGSGLTQAAYPQIGSSGDLNGDGVSDLWARQADNTVLGWNGVASGGTVTAFSSAYQIDGVPGAKIPGGTTLASGEEFASGNSKLVMQADGNLVLKTKDNKAIWATNTSGNQGALARMQADGNFVVYAANGTTVLWSSKTATPYSYAVLHSRGVLVIYNASGQSLWSSGTQSRPDYNGDGYTDVLARDANGDMWVYPGTGGTGTNTLGSRYFVGNGWWRDYWKNAYTADFNNDGFTDIVGRNKDGDLYLYPGRAGTNSFGSPVQIGAGWNIYENLGFGDINGDGRTDVIARDSGGNLWVHPGSGGTGIGSLGARALIGNGWWPNGWTSIRFADLNGDSKIDILGRNTNGGELYVYPNTTDSNGTMSFGSPVFSGNGFWDSDWNPYASDLNSDGPAEIVGVNAVGDLCDFASGRTLISSGWSGIDVIL